MADAFEVPEEWRATHQVERDLVKQLGSAIGYGNMITLARELWAEMLTPSLGEETARRHSQNWGCTCEECSGERDYGRG